LAETAKSSSYHNYLTFLPFCFIRGYLTEPLFKDGIIAQYANSVAANTNISKVITGSGGSDEGRAMAQLDLIPGVSISFYTAFLPSC
jgi:hypothetical protein